MDPAARLRPVLVDLPNPRCTDHPHAVHPAVGQHRPHCVGWGVHRSADHPWPASGNRSASLERTRLASTNSHTSSISGPWGTSHSPATSPTPPTPSTPSRTGQAQEPRGGIHRPQCFGAMHQRNHRVALHYFGTRGQTHLIGPSNRSRRVRTPKSAILGLSPADQKIMTVPTPLSFRTSSGIFSRPPARSALCRSRFGCLEFLSVITSIRTHRGFEQWSWWALDLVGIHACSRRVS